MSDLSMQKRLQDVIPIPDAKLLGMARAHAVATVVVGNSASTLAPPARPVCAANVVYDHIGIAWSIRPRCTALGGGIMIKHLMEGLVRDVVLSVIGDEAEHLTLESDFDVLDVDQLTITYIVLALESRLGIELPTHLEDARTVAELVAGTRDALRANAVTKGRLPESDELPLIRIGRPALRRNSGRRNLLELSPWRPRPHKLGNRATRVE